MGGAGDLVGAALLWEGTMYLIIFEPGDGTSYRILFGRLPSQSPFPGPTAGAGFPHYTVFGIAEGSSEPGAWYAFDNERVTEDIFYDHINPFATLERTTYLTGWRAWLALTGQADDDQAAARLPEWKPMWREQLAPFSADLP
jgi:hypothetical protein